MIYNLVNAELSVENEERAIQLLQEVETLLPFMINLSPEDRQELPKMGKKTLDFVERTIIYAREHREFVPPYLNLDDTNRDFTLYNQLRRILSVLEPLCEKLKETHMMLSVESYSGARIFYRAVQSAAKSGVKGSDVILEDLKARYRKRYEKDDASPALYTPETPLRHTSPTPAEILATASQN